MNLALIVSHLLTHPRGWRVDQLKDELGIADRTYRKYRRVLMHEFPPFQRRDGSSSLCEVKDGKYTYLRIVPDPETATTGKQFSSKLAALLLARSALAQVAGGTEVYAAMNAVLANYMTRFKDRSFVQNGFIKEAQSRFAVSATEDESTLDELCHAAVFGRRVLVKTGIGDYILDSPTLSWRRGRLWVTSECVELAVESIASVAT